MSTRSHRRRRHDRCHRWPKLCLRSHGQKLITRSRVIRSEAAYAKLCGSCPIPASSGKTNRHRLTGHAVAARQANSAPRMERAGRHPRRRACTPGGVRTWPAQAAVSGTAATASADQVDGHRDRRPGRRPPHGAAAEAGIDVDARCPRRGEPAVGRKRRRGRGVPRAAHRRRPDQVLAEVRRILRPGGPFGYAADLERTCRSLAIGRNASLRPG